MDLHWRQVGKGLTPDSRGYTSAEVRGNMLNALLRLVQTAGICSMPSSDWFKRQEYALCPPPIGSNGKKMLFALLRLVQTAGICSMPSAEVRGNAPRCRGVPRGDSKGQVTIRVVTMQAQG
eukprot:3188278-Pyramimonas_sp.AAC.1